MLLSDKQLSLFPDLMEESASGVLLLPKRQIIDPFHRDILQGINFTSIHQMPKVKGVRLFGPPQYLIGYDRIAGGIPYNSFVHFYIEDYKQMVVLNRFDETTMKLRNLHCCVIGPDFSIRTDMPLALKIANSFWIKAITAGWQQRGIVAIPNVVWSDLETLDICLEGYPKYSCIAINSTGIGRDTRSVELWRQGYLRAINQLQPTYILRYGVPQEGELYGFSSYYPNNNFTSCNHGW